MRIAAVADVHSPRFLKEFTRSLKLCGKPDLFLLAGDIVNRGAANEYPRVLDAIDQILGKIPVVACFGNEEYHETRNEIMSLAEKRVTFLDESSTFLILSNTKIGIVGASVLLEQTRSTLQGNNDQHYEIKNAFEKRALRVSQLLQKLANTVDYTILLLHYSPLSEESATYSWWISKALEKVKPSLIVHGHVHASTNHKVVIGTTSVYNVALPAVGRITELSLND